jgi:hypothetical protein
VPLQRVNDNRGRIIVVVAGLGGSREEQAQRNNATALKSIG